MDVDKFRKKFSRNPSPPPDCSKIVKHQVKTEDEDEDSDSDTVLVPRASVPTSKETIEKFKTELVQLREKLFHLEHSVLPSKNQEIDALHTKLTSYQIEMDKLNSDKKLTEEKFIDTVCKLMETEVALKTSEEKYESLSTALEATLGDLKKGHGEEVEILQTKLVEKDLQLEVERKVTCDLKLKLEKATETHEREMSSAVIQALKVQLWKEEQLAEEKKSSSDLKLKVSFVELRLQEKEEELMKANEENQKLIDEYTEIRRMMVQYRSELDKCEEEKISIRENALQESLELVGVNLEHLKEIQLLKARLEALQNPCPYENVSDDDNDSEIFGTVHSEETHSDASESIGTHPPVQKRAEISSKALKRKKFDEMKPKKIKDSQQLQRR